MIVNKWWHNSFRSTRKLLIDVIVQEINNLLSVKVLKILEN